MITREEIIKKYGKPDPNKKNNFINYDIIDSLPDELEPCFSELKFDPNKLDEYFTNMGNETWYPQTDTMYKIADMCGICGESEKTVEWITEEVDINPILMRSITDEPTMRKMIVAARVAKQSRILCKDNTWRVCTAETNEFNFFDRACLEFLTEEEYTKDYTIYSKYKNSGKEIPYKYNTVKKRQKRLIELKKFAIQQAETKAFCKTIRVLAGLPTGFETDDLKEGKLIFMKFIKSKRIQKLETAARIESIRNGNTRALNQITADIMGDHEQIEAPITEEPIHEHESEPVKEKSPFEQLQQKENNEDVEKLRNILKEYIKPGHNRGILAKQPGAIDMIEKAIKNSDKKDDFMTLIGTIEQVRGIKKIEIGAEQEEDEGGLF